MILLCPQAAGSAAAMSGLAGVENILCPIPQQTKSTDRGLHSNRWGLGRRGRRSDVSKPRPTSVLAFRVVGAWVEVSVRQAPSQARQPSRDTQGWEEACKPQGTPPRGLCPGQCRKGPKSQSPSPREPLLLDSALPETQAWLVSCKGLRTRREVFCCCRQRNSCLIPPKSPPNPNPANCT